MVQDLIENGDIGDAYRELFPMAERVKRAGDFYSGGPPIISPEARCISRIGRVLGRDIELLQAWAKSHQ